jgi:hypothetical protein
MRLPYIARLPRGAIAQLGERLHGMQEVAGSIPASSTKIFGVHSLRSASKKLESLLIIY